MGDHQRARALRLGITAAVLVVVAVVAGGWFVAARQGPGGQVPRFEAIQGEVGPVAHDYVIPAGTSARLARREAVEVMPRELRGRVGELIRFRNDDGDAAFVGPFYVPAGATQVQRLAAPGVLEGLCTVHPDGQFTIVVEA